MWFGQRAPYHDHDVLPWIHVYVLAEDAAGLEGAFVRRAFGLGNRPQHVAVVDLLTVDGLRRARFFDPSFGQDAFVTGDTVVEQEQAEAAVVAQRRGKAAAAHLEAIGRFEPPGGVRLHTDLAPDPLRQILAHRLADRSANQRPGDVGFARAVVPARAWLGGARQFGHQCQHATGCLGVLHFEHAATVRFRVGVGLVPAHARGHLQQIAYAHAVIGAALELRQILDDGIVDALDVPVLDGRADQRGGDGFHHRHGHPAGVFGVAELVVLVGDLAILDDQQAADTVKRHVVVQIVRFAVGLELEVLQRLLRGGKWQHLTALPDRASGKQSIDVAESVHLDARHERAVIDLLDGADGLIGMRVRHFGSQAQGG